MKHIADLARACLLFACTGAAGFVLLVLLFKSGALHGMNVLFYRGLILIGLAGLATFALALFAGRWFGTAPSVALAAAVLSMSLNLTFLIVFPVTIDRSITVFLLATMDAHPDTAYTPDQLREIFARQYLGQWQQIDRRMHEQLVSRNVVQVGDAYKISPQGHSFMNVSRLLAGIFDTDPRFVHPEAGTKPANNR